jgi:hypothetical protein
VVPDGVRGEVQGIYGECEEVFLGVNSH